MLYFLENDRYKVGIDSQGAELQHFVKKDENLELIWVADPKVWSGHAPNLFPIVGELPNQQYTYHGKAYHLPRHGFARRKEFELVEEHHDKLVFELEHDESTLAVYPFRFRLLIAYKLVDNQLAVTYLVRNEEEEAMWFSIGAHPGFNVPLYQNEDYTDYYLEFEKEETLSRYLLNEQGLLNGDTERVLQQERVLPLSHQYFEKDAIVLKELNSKKVTLASKTNPRRIEVAFEGFPYLGIWAKPGPSPYVCIEPWCGIASKAGASGELQEKEGINQLGPKQSFERTFIITVL
ncbi:galactose mutarotase-like enzyme [Pontibacter ummariensis]|uniref:Galactose mutarotase n=1 Tax=Pontibacter ummariensis TaxID=1610492 RepID=A0A239B5F1_9BACT|nr:aldose 1-epimerase family protein [Pontibacter ummariensis]PRY16282.1 galactose mutarotase-like enzyme [Pontibacter ummariensis]SNS02458.1 Galactose mutarotase [Pontibacter ummariensis]